jgi:preprotein translocase subunit YajC
MKFKKWCISTVDTVKDKPEEQKEKKSFSLFKKKNKEED